MGQYHFYKEERLKHRKSIGELFSKGKTLYIYPFKVFYRMAPAQSTHHKVLFAIPNRSIKKALNRNKIKRRAREVYRTTKHMLQHNPKLHIGFVYTSSEVLPYKNIQHAIRQSVQKLGKVKKTPQ